MLSVSGTRGEEGKTWVKRMAGVVCCGQCSLSGGSVDEGWQFGSAGTSCFRRYVIDFQELVSIGEGEHGEIAGGTAHGMGSIILIEEAGGGI